MATPKTVRLPNRIFRSISFARVSASDDLGRRASTSRSKNVAYAFGVGSCLARRVMFEVMRHARRPLPTTVSGSLPAPCGTQTAVSRTFG